MNFCYRWFGREQKYNVLVTELLGSSLKILLDSTRSKRFTIKTVLLLADQMIDRIERLHSTLYCHRHIKAENFSMGIGSQSNKVIQV